MQTQIKRGITILKDNALYRRYVLVRLALTVAGWAAPFYVVYAKNELGIPASMLGLYLSARTVAGIASNLFWGRISDRLGNRRLIIGTTAVGAATPVIVLLVGMVNRSVPGASNWLMYLYALVFLTAGAFGPGSGMGMTNYLLEIAPDEERPLYLAVTNTLFGLARFTGMASGLIVDWVGFTVLLMLSAGLYVLALILAGGMQEPRSLALQS
jgi:MFS family permease